MLREDLKELHYIADIRNVGSILSKGILCKNQADKTQHSSFALESVQDVRARKKLPNSLSIHDHAVLYLWARNTTLFRIVAEKRIPLDSLCVLRVRPEVLDLEGAFLSDRNATCTFVRFGTVEEILPNLNYDRIRATFWNHADPIERQRHAEEMCAELLVPTAIPASFIGGACVPNASARTSFAEVAPDLPLHVSKDFFFPSKW